MYTYSGRVIEIVELDLLKVDIDLGFHNHTIQLIYIDTLVMPRFSKSNSELELRHAEMTREFMERVVCGSRVYLRPIVERGTRRSVNVGRPIYRSDMQLYLAPDNPIHPKGEYTEPVKVSLTSLLRERNFIRQDYTTNLSVVHMILNQMEATMFNPIDPKKNILY